VMGIKRERVFSPLPREVSLEDLVPEDSFYRRLEAALDLSFVRDLVRPLYAGGGRPSVDPVVFFKLQLVLFFEGLRSERELMRVAADRISVRWYLGYDLHEPLPDHFRASPERANALASPSSGVSSRRSSSAARRPGSCGGKICTSTRRRWTPTPRQRLDHAPLRRGRALGWPLRGRQARRGGGRARCLPPGRPRRVPAGRERGRGRLDLQQRASEAGGEGRLVQTHRRLPLLRDRPGRLAPDQRRDSTRARTWVTTPTTSWTAGKRASS